MGNSIEDRINNAYCFLNSMHSDFRTALYYKEDLENLDHILSDYKRVLKENEELKKFITEGITIEPNSPYKNYQLDFLRKNFIPRQNIKDKIEELNNNKENYTFYRITSEDIRKTVITNLQELLEREEE